MWGGEEVQQVEHGGLSSFVDTHSCTQGRSGPRPGPCFHAATRAREATTRHRKRRSTAGTAWHEACIVHGPGLQIAPLYLHGDADRTRRVREEMLQHNLACGLRVLPFSSTRWKIIGVGECGDWDDLPAEVDVLVPSFQAYEDWNTERPHVEAGNLLEVLEVVGDIGGEILSWPL